MSTESPLVLRGRIVTPRGVLDDGVVVVDDATIVSVGPADRLPRGWSLPSPRATRRSCPAWSTCTATAAANRFPDAVDAAEAQRAVDEHRRHGTTSLVASLVTAPADVLLSRAAMLADLANTARSWACTWRARSCTTDRCGAQNPADMLPGDPDLVRAIAGAARGHLVTMTVAPEVPGADAVLEALVDVGAVPSIGRTDASAEQVDEAVDRGFDLLAARSNGRLTATYRSTACASLRRRDPRTDRGVPRRRGPRGAGGRAGGGRHRTLAEHVLVFDLVGAGSIALVTDAMAAAGMPDGEYRLRRMAVLVADGGGAGRRRPGRGEWRACSTSSATSSRRDPARGRRAGGVERARGRARPSATSSATPGPTSW